MHMVYLAAGIVSVWALVSLVAGCVLGRALRRAEVLPVLAPASSSSTFSIGDDQWAA